MLNKLANIILFDLGKIVPLMGLRSMSFKVSNICQTLTYYGQGVSVLIEVQSHKVITTNIPVTQIQHFQAGKLYDDVCQSQV